MRRLGSRKVWRDRRREVPNPQLFTQQRGLRVQVSYRYELENILCFHGIFFTLLGKLQKWSRKSWKRLLLAFLPFYKRHKGHVWSKLKFDFKKCCCPLLNLPFIWCNCKMGKNGKWKLFLNWKRDWKRRKIGEKASSTFSSLLHRFSLSRFNRPLKKLIFQNFH